MLSMMYWSSHSRRSEPFFCAIGSSPMANAVVAIDVCLRLRLSCIDLFYRDVVHLSPFAQRFADMFGALSNLIVHDLSRHSITLSRLRLTRSAGSEESASVPSPSSLKSSSTFSGQIALGLAQDLDYLRLNVSTRLHSDSVRSSCGENYTFAPH